MIKVGQIWQVVDPRFERRVKIEDIRSLDMPKGILISNVDSGRKSWASAERFKGKRGGFKLVHD